MTDDYHLFADPRDDEGPLDPDVALLSAYLARELSPLQVLAVEERLATDVPFRRAMQPLLDAWAAPVPALSHGTAARVPPLSPLERATSWRRFTREVPDALSSPSDSTPAIPSIQRRLSMRRIAAVLAIAALPMVAFAQAVVYAANHADAPGHAMASRLVAAFTADGTSPSVERAATVNDTRWGESLSLAQRAARGTQPSWGDTMPPRTLANPDRAKIADLIRQHQAAVVRGDTSVEYVVVVLDAAEQYLWSTIGDGSLSIQVAGDPRTPSERRAFLRDHQDTFWGPATPAGVLTKLLSGDSAAWRYRSAVADSASSPRTIKGTLTIDRAPVDSGGRFVFRRGDSTIVGDFQLYGFLNDSALAGTKIRTARGAGGGAGGAGGGARGRGPGGTSGTLTLRGDSVAIADRLVTLDSLGGTLRGTTLNLRFQLDSTGGSSWTVGVRGGNTGSAAGGGGRGARGAGAGAAGTADKAGPYTSGWSSTRNGPVTNQGYGLQEATAGQSGIQGIASSSVASADLYHFAAGELSPRTLSVMVVQLTPGTVWKRRQ